MAEISIKQDGGCINNKSIVCVYENFINPTINENSFNITIFLA